MNKLAMLICAGLLMPALARAQEVGPESHGHGYAFFAGGAATTFSCRSCTFGTIHVGGGGEATFYKGLGIGAEAGYLVPAEDTSSGLGLASLNAVYIFRGKGRSRIEPFLTGGGTVGFAAGGAFGGINFGGGIQYWMRNRIGLRFEFRDHVPTQSLNSHLFEGRVGISFR